MRQAAKSGATLGVLCVLLVIAGVWGWNTATAPLPGKSDPPICVATPVEAGDRVFPQQVTVSVYNASERNGLAGSTMDQFADQGFTKGGTGNAPRGVSVRSSAIWTTSPDDPDVRLVASRLGRSVEMVDREGRGLGVTVVVGEEFGSLRDGMKSVRASEDTEICSPPIT